ncbi:MAG: 4Fe-4S binding protein [Clostridia bacterium]|nr:4Fe-4S binding protein [Clostridia bacterium]
MGNNPLEIFIEKCKACGICYTLCPRQAIGSDEQGKVIITEIDKCTKCGICENHCPDYAIIVRREKN